VDVENGKRFDPTFIRISVWPIADRGDIEVRNAHGREF
jgi:hypothetical protein